MKARKAAIDSSALIFAFKVPPMLKLLQKRFSKMLVAEAVYEEVVETGERMQKEEVSAIKQSFESGFLQKQKAKPLAQLKQGLGAGECEALSLSLYSKTILVSDDRKARVAGKAIGVKVIPLSAFIIWARENGGMTKTEAEETLNDLVKKNYYIDADVYVKLLEKIREGMKS